MAPVGFISPCNPSCILALGFLFQGKIRFKVGDEAAPTDVASQTICLSNGHRRLLQVEGLTDCCFCKCHAAYPSPFVSSSGFWVSSRQCASYLITIPRISRRPAAFRNRPT